MVNEDDGCEDPCCTAGNMSAFAGVFFPSAGYEQADSIFPWEISLSSFKPQKKKEP